MPRPDRAEKGMPADPVRALRAREALGDLRQLVAEERWKDAAPVSHALVQLAPDLAEAYELMGIVAFKTGAIAVAEGCFERSVALGPATASRLLNWGKALLAQGEPAAAEKTLHRALLIRADDPAILAELGDAQLNQHRTGDALKSFRRVLKKQPDHRYAAHMVAALTTTGVPDKDYVTRLFDDYAPIFDQHLTQTLGYRVPQALVDLLRGLGIPSGPTLDLGCGTGLVAAALAGAAPPIDGIDLAPRMIEQARARGLYRHLAVGDCAEVLDSDPAFARPYSLVIAADVFIYIGALEPLFEALMPRLATDAVLTFSVETSTQDGVEIRSSGRFAHSAGYIAGLAVQRGFNILAQEPHPIRLEQEKPIPGMLYLLGRS